MVPLGLKYLHCTRSKNLTALHSRHLAVRFFAQVVPNVFGFSACPWVAVGTGQLQTCVGPCGTQYENPISRALAIKAIFVAFILISD